MKKLVRTGIAVALSLSVGLGLSACGSEKSEDSKANSSTSAPAKSEASSEAKSDAQESEAFVADMKKAVDTIKEQLAKQAGQTQVMIASDVDQPTEKYGLWVLPYYPSDAVKKFTMAIQVKDDKFQVTCVSAATGKTWKMDQDYNMTEASK